MNTGALAGFAAGVILLYLVGYVLMVPGRYFLRFLVNAALGGLGLWLAACTGPIWGITLGINPITALVSGFLGIPGVVLLVALKAVL